MKRVSVILTTYNGEDTVTYTIDSIRNQIGLNQEFELEIIVVDDCSTDKTVGILKNLGLSPISTNENSGGPNKGRNIGLKTCTGDFICIVDQDDVWENNRIIMMLPYFENHPIVTSGYTVLNSRTKGKMIKTNSHGDGYITYKRNETFISKLTKSRKGQHKYLGSIMFSKELKHIEFEEEHGMVDFDWSLRLFYQRESVEICQSLYTRSVSMRNLSYNESYRQNDFRHSLHSIEQYADEFPNQVRLAGLKIHGSMARFYYLIGDMKKARQCFLKADFNWKTVLYYITTFVGHSIVKRRINVFG